MLGQISKINDDDIALSLPNNLTGYIPSTSISRLLTERLLRNAEKVANSENGQPDVEGAKLSLSNLFSVGQYLRAAIVSTEVEMAASTRTKRHIELSLEPEKANASLKTSDMVNNCMVQAFVRSKEDRGMVMDLGIEHENVRGFLDSKEMGTGMGTATLQEGSICLCLVIGKSSDGGTIKLSLDQQKISNVKKVAFVADAPSVDSFLPGTAIEILVSEVDPSGLHGKVMGLLDVTADIIHCGSASSNKERERKYPVGSKTKARIICTFPTSGHKKLGVSLQDHILYWRPKTVNETSGPDSVLPTSILPTSSIVEEAKVAKVDPGNGLYLDVGVKGVRGFAHISKLADTRTDNISTSSGAFRVGSTHKARVIGYNPMDGLFILSLEPKVIDQPFLYLEDVKIGQIVKGIIQKRLISAPGVEGLILELANGISGLVPQIHLADTRSQYPERNLREGMTVTARVLSVDLQKHQIRLTLKKSLINSDVEPWKDIECLKQGMQGVGTLINISSKGAVVQFYGSVRAFLPVAQMSESFIQDPKQHFEIGQVVNVHITSIDLEKKDLEKKELENNDPDKNDPDRNDTDKKRMKVSCIYRTTSGEAAHEAIRALSVGQKIIGKVTERTAAELLLELEGSGLKATLSFEHLVDGSTKKAESVAKRIRIGQVLKDIIILSTSDVKHLVQLTSKPSLLEAAEKGTLLRTIDDVVEGADVCGYVNNITAIGVFVRFGGDLTGLLLKQHLEDEAAKLPDYGLRRDQSISTRVLSANHIKDKFLLTKIARNDAGTTVTSSEAMKANGLPINDLKLSNPVDGTSTSVEDFTIGLKTKARVVSVKETQINVQLADGIQGRIDVSEVFDNMGDVSDRKYPLKKFHAKMIVPVRILGMHDPRNHRFLPVTHRRGGASVYELTTKPSNLTTERLEVLTIANIKEGSSWLATVNNIAEDCLWVNLSPNVRGRIRAMDVSDDVSLLRDLEANFPIGSILRVKVLKANSETNHLDLTARSSGSSKSVTLEDLSSGMVLPGRVTKVTDRHIMVQLDESCAGAVHIIDIADDYSKANPKLFSKNQTVRVSIKKVDQPNKKIILSTRPSKVLSSSLPVQDKEITSFSQLKINDIIRGFVKNVADNGVFISLATDITGFVRVSDLSDLFIKDWKAGFEVDQLVEGKIIAIDPHLNHVQMSLKKSHLDKDYKPPLTFADMEVGQVVTGKIRKVEDFGVFVVVDNSANVSGLCHKSKMSNTGADPRKLYEEGDAVQAKILNINTQKRQISLGLKPSYFDSTTENQTSGEDLGDSDGDDDKLGDEADDVSMSDNGGVELEGFDLGEDDDDDSDGDDDDDDDLLEGGTSVDAGNLSSLGISEDNDQNLASGTGFYGLSTGKIDWTGGMETFEDDAQSEPRGAATSSQPLPSKKQKKKKKQNSDGAVPSDLTGDLDAHGPQTAADFERRLLSQPHSSFLWIQYMSLQLSLSEPTTARAIAERALSSIPLGAEEEKKNIWLALLNLDSKYSTPATLATTLTQACQHNDPAEMYTAVISNHIHSGRYSEADTLYQTALQKVTSPGGTLSSLYENYASFLFNPNHSPSSSPTRARALLPRAMQSLPPTTHIALTTRFAQLEFKLADPERGRTMFETLLEKWPKRWDLWSVWLDMEIGLVAKNEKEKAKEKSSTDKATTNQEQEQQEEVVRRLFERIVSGAGGGNSASGSGSVSGERASSSSSSSSSSSLKPRQAKAFFKKWLDWEDKMGNNARGQKARVELLAREYVNNNK